MTLLRSVAEDTLGEREDVPPADIQPQVFMRVFTTPPGAPWEQMRAASMEVRHGAPLPIADLMFRVRRLESWRPGGPGRYAAFYIRSRDYRVPFETEVDVEGQAHTVAFGTNPQKALQMRRLAVVAGIVALTGIILAGGGALASSVRAEAEARLSRLEQQSRQKLKTAQSYKRQKELAADLETATAGRVRMSDVLEDLAWVATAKSADARIVAVHWEQGVLAAEVQGEGSPFPAPDRQVERYEKAIRPGVWLWGVGPRGSGTIRPAKEVGP